MEGRDDVSCCHQGIANDILLAHRRQEFGWVDVEPDLEIHDAVARAATPLWKDAWGTSFDGRDFRLFRAAGREIFDARP